MTPTEAQKRLHAIDLAMFSASLQSGQQAKAFEERLRDLGYELRPIAICANCGAEAHPETPHYFDKPAIEQAAGERLPGAPGEASILTNSPAAAAPLCAECGERGRILRDVWVHDSPWARHPFRAAIRRYTGTDPSDPFYQAAEAADREAADASERPLEAATSAAPAPETWYICPVDKGHRHICPPKPAAVAPLDCRDPDCKWRAGRHYQHEPDGAIYALMGTAPVAPLELRDWREWNLLPQPDGMVIYDPDGFRFDKPEVVTYPDFLRARMECTLVDRRERTTAAVAPLAPESAESGVLDVERLAAALDRITVVPSLFPASLPSKGNMDVAKAIAAAYAADAEEGALRGSRVEDEVLNTSDGGGA